MSLRYKALFLIFYSGLAFSDNGLNLTHDLQIPTPPDAVNIESICGATVDFQDVEQYDGTLGATPGFVAMHQEAVGQVQWDNNLAAIYNDPGNVNNMRWCSGTLIGRNLFLTAGHCFDVQPNDGRNWDFPLDNNTGVEITPQQAALNMHINFNYQRDPTGQLRQEIEVDIVSLREYRINGLDYAVLQLAGNPGDALGFTQISGNVPDFGELLTLIQHPAGEPKVIEAGPYDGLATNGQLAGYMRYADLDTRGGSSGSGVLNTMGQIVGVHTNAGCTRTGGANHGVSITDIRAVSPIVSDILNSHAGWVMFDQNPATEKIVADDHRLYQLHDNGRIWLYEGTPITGWQMLDQNPHTVDIAASGGNLYQLHNSGWIWRYTGTPLTGWQLIDTNPAAVKIVADGDNLYQMHSNGRIWRYTGIPFSGWQLLDRNPSTVDIVASGGRLYQRHSNGGIWEYTGTPISGWRMLDGNPATVDIIADGNNLYQLHNNGRIWRFTGIPFSGWQLLDRNSATVEISASNGNLYQRHSSGRVWQYTGTPISGWRLLDSNSFTESIVADQDNLYQLHNTGRVWSMVPRN